MAWSGWSVLVGALLLFATTGCPLTDDYYIETSRVSSGGSSDGNPGALPSTLSAGGALGCVPTTERCNGHDDDCDGLTDELVCNSMPNGTVGCSGFVLPDHPSHGYMLCSSPKAYANAQSACAAQNMRLAWLETEAENTGVSQKVAALSKDIEVTFGANDIANEGEWYWDGGEQFWRGNGTGAPVGGLFNAWAPGTPNNQNNDEDCAVLTSASRAWGDRPCSAKYAYLCEEAVP